MCGIEFVIVIFLLTLKLLKQLKYNIIETVKQFIFVKLIYCFLFWCYNIYNFVSYDFNVLFTVSILCFQTIEELSLANSQCSLNLILVIQRLKA